MERLHVPYFQYHSDKLKYWPILKIVGLELKKQEISHGTVVNNHKRL